MWLIVGLGNPGPKYQQNRHNVGFRVADELVRRHDLGAPKQRFGGDLFTGSLAIGGRMHRVAVLEPMEFMNRSGFAVQRAAAFHDVLPEDIIVIHDELDIDFGRVKLKQGGGHGGHNGLRSIVEQLGSRDFLRVRVGIGKPEPVSDPAARDRRVIGHVLSDFPAALASEVETLVGRAADATELIVAHGIRHAMAEFHSNND